MPKDCRLEGLYPGCANPPGRKVPGFRGKAVHFPGGNAKGLPPGGLYPGCADQPGGRKGARRKGNAATDAVADMVRELTFRRWDDFAGKLLLEVDVEAADPFALGSGLDDYDVTADAVLVDAVGLEEGVAVAADDDVDIL